MLSLRIKLFLSFYLLQKEDHAVIEMTSFYGLKLPFVESIAIFRLLSLISFNIVNFVFFFF